MTTVTATVLSLDASSSIGGGRAGEIGRCLDGDLEREPDLNGFVGPFGSARVAMNKLVSSWSRSKNLSVLAGLKKAERQSTVMYI